MKMNCKVCFHCKTYIWLYYNYTDCFICIFLFFYQFFFIFTNNFCRKILTTLHGIWHQYIFILNISIDSVEKCDLTRNNLGATVSPKKSRENNLHNFYL